MPYKKEIRTIGTELRAAGGSGDADPLVIEGYAAKFNRYSQDLGGFKERIMPGAFARALKEQQDIRCLVNHDPNLILGRSTKPETLTLREDQTGLFFRCTLPNTQVARDLHENVKTGLIDQCSFSFAAISQKWAEEQNDMGDWFASRELHDVDLFDVSAVTYPAYLDTEVNARTQEAAVPAELRSAVDARNQEKRDATLEATIQAISAALKEKFGVAAGGWNKYSLVETYPDHAIVCDWDKGCYYSVPFTITLTPGEDVDSDDVSLGDLTEVQKEWVPTTERGKRALAEFRAAVNRAKDPDGDGDDDSDLLDCLSTSADACNAVALAATESAKGLTEESLLAFVTKGQAAIAAITEAVAEATAELAEDQDALPPAGEKRNAKDVSDPDSEDYDPEDPEYDESLDPTNGEGRIKSVKVIERVDPAATKPHTEGVSRVPGARDGYDDLEEDPDYEGEFDNALEPAAFANGHMPDGECSIEHCSCQNRWHVTGDESGTRAAAPGEQRADKKARTKRVGDKDLTKDKFAFVGDPTRTETWKLPIHDEAHVRNALARFNQTEGIPADKKAGVWRKIVAAAHKYDIKVSGEDDRAARATFPPDEQERLLMLARLTATVARN